jgi:hypothetical protein
MITVSKADKAFRAAHKPDPAYRPFSAADRKRLGKRLPEIMLALLDRDGWCSYDDQLFWLCDPDDWEKAARAWLPEPSAACDVLVRSSFGDLLAWDGERFWLVLPHLSQRIGQTSDPNWLFASTLGRDGVHFHGDLVTETAAARKKCGPLGWDQMYNYAPALALGGSVKRSEIARESAPVALSILSQLAPVQTIDV